MTQTFDNCNSLNLQDQQSQQINDILDVDSSLFQFDLEMMFRGNPNGIIVGSFVEYPFFEI
jgi:hypothetical protein